MTNSMKALLASAALAGMMTGARERLQALTPNQGDRVSAQDSGLTETSAKKEKHACKGQNSCKGKGGCSSGDNGCKGKNSCKGKGGCATDGSKKSDQSSQDQK